MAQVQETPVRREQIPSRPLSLKRVLIVSAARLRSEQRENERATPVRALRTRGNERATPVGALRTQGNETATPVRALRTRGTPIISPKRLMKKFKLME